MAASQYPLTQVPATSASMAPRDSMAVPVSADNGYPASYGYPIGQTAAPSPASAVSPMEIMGNVTLPDDLNEFNPGEGNGASIYGGGIGTNMVFGDNVLPFQSTMININKRTNRTAGTNTNSYTSANLLLEARDDRDSADLGVAPNGTPLFMKVRQGKTVLYQRSTLEVSTVLTLQQLNYVLLHESINEANGTSAMDMDDSFEVKDLSTGWSFIGFSETPQSVMNGEYRSQAAITNGQYDVPTLWPGRLYIGDTVGFIGKYVPRHEVVGGMYHFNDHTNEVMPADVPEMVYQIVPWVGRDIDGSLQRPMLQDLSSVDSTGLRRVGRWIPVGIVGNEQKTSPPQTNNVFFDAKAQGAGRGIHELHFECA